MRGFRATLHGQTIEQELCWVRGSNPRACRYENLSRTSFTIRATQSVICISNKSRERYLHSLSVRIFDIRLNSPADERAVFLSGLAVREGVYIFFYILSIHSIATEL